MFRFAVLFFALFIAAGARAQQLTLPDVVSTRSISGQFAVIAEQQISSLANEPSVATNSDYVRLEPALLAVSAERIKQSLWRQLDVNDSHWRGQIFLALHPAHSLDENVRIVSSRFNHAWIYRVELPDILTRARFARALTGVVLLELANRSAGERSAEIPDWLVEGFSEQLLAQSLSALILSSPEKSRSGVLENRIIRSQRGWDLLAGAQRVLKDQPALTFDQLSWPTDKELADDDGGVYRASAQLFVHDLLDLKNGAAELCAMLQSLPHFYNWQLAFYRAFKTDFSEPVDLEKWWALKVVSFAAHDGGPTWTPAASRARLAEILSVPVDYRSASNNLPAHAEVSLQEIIRNFSPQRQISILQTKLRDLQLAELQMPPKFAELTGQYRQALAGYLGEKKSPRWLVVGKHFFASDKNTTSSTLKKLNALDARRRAMELALENNAAGMPALTAGKSHL